MSRDGTCASIIDWQIMEIELTPFQKQIEKLILSTPPPGRHSARNAILHIKKAWMLKEMDPEIAVFRAITGEEEAATAIFHSLKRHKYAGAEQLKPHNHVHKAALYPFFLAVGSVLFLLNKENLNPQVNIDTKAEGSKVNVRFTLPGGEKYVYPDPPLHFSIKRDGEIYDFSDELKTIAETNQVESIDKHVRHLANERKQLLYAAKGGILKFTQPQDDTIKQQLSKVFHMLILYLLIDQYSEHQWFVQQPLNAFLLILGKLPADFRFE